MGDFSLQAVSFCAKPVVGSASEQIDNLLPAPVQIGLMKASLEKHVDLKIDVITDRNDFGEGICVIRPDYPIDHSIMMLQAARLFSDYFHQYNFGSPAIVSDPDLLFFKDISDLFELDFDVALTIRSGDDMPFNSGVLYVNNHRPHAVRKFFLRQVQIIEDILLDHSNWFADQLVLSEIINRSTLVEPDIYVFEDVRILIIPAETWNYSPPREHPNLLKRHQMRVYHFKGRCRTYMPYFFRKYFEGGWLNPIVTIRDFVKSENLRSASKETFLKDKKRVKPSRDKR